MGLYTILAALLLQVGCGSAGTGSNITQTDPVSEPPLAYASRTDLSTGGVGADSLVLADFNGDGKPDIAVCHLNSKTISVFLNNGDGTFQGPIVTAVTTAEISLGNLAGIAAGDFNEDGKTDLVVAGGAGNGTASLTYQDAILLGNGDGTFRDGPAMPNSAVFFPGKPVDLDGDGHLDLVGFGGGFVSVFSATVMARFDPETRCPPGRNREITRPSPLATLTVTKRQTFWFATMALLSPMGALEASPVSWFSMPEMGTEHSNLRRSAPF